MMMLGPPVSKCYECDANLVAYHNCSVKYYTLKGVKMLEKVSLRYTGVHNVTCCTTVPRIVTNTGWGFGTIQSYKKRWRFQTLSTLSVTFWNFGAVWRKCACISYVLY